MPFMVKAFYDGHPLTLTSETAKEAFAKAIEWHIVQRLINVTINDGTKSYTIAEFSSAMALLETANTVEVDALGLKAKGK